MPRPVTAKTLAPSIHVTQQKSTNARSNTSNARGDRAQSNANDCVPSGTASHSSGGETPAPSHVKRGGSICTLFESCAPNFHLPLLSGSCRLRDFLNHFSSYLSLFCAS